MTLLDILGLVAGSLTTLAFLPQVLKTWKSRSARDISHSWLLLFSIGIFLWFLYGLFRRDLSIVLANGITLMLVSVIFFFKVKYQ